MSTLSTTRNYDDGEVLVRADLDAFLDDIETFLNVTKISDDNIQNSGITGSTKLLNQSVTAAKLATNSVTTLKIEDDAVTNAKIADDAVDTAQIADAAVEAAQLATDAVTEDKILDAAVTTDKIANDAVTNAKVADNAVDTAQIVDSAVTTAKINANAVTPAKMSVYYTSGTISTDTNFADGETKTIGSLTVTGRPVRITITDGELKAVFSDNNECSVSLQYSSDNASWSTLKQVARLATVNLSGGGYFRSFGISSNDTGLWDGADNKYSIDAPAIVIHTPSAGTAYYRLLASVNGGTLSIETAITVWIEEL